MRLTIILGLAMVMALPKGAESGRPIANTTERYDGTWWLASSAEKRSGFLEGAADCLTWVVGAKRFSGTSNQLVGKITHYYRAHPAEQRALIIDVWQRVDESAAPKPPRDGEIWKNPHWYLNGLWWRQSSEEERLGFLEGFLSCLHIGSSPRKNTYSRPIGWYKVKISEYIDAHSAGDDEPVATILERFKDRPGK